MKPSLWILVFLTISGARCAEKTLTDEEITELSKLLWETETKSNPDPGVVLNFQGKTYSRGNRDMAAERLFQRVDETFFQRPTVTAFINLLDNYEPLVGNREIEDNLENLETDTFVDTIINSPVIKKFGFYLSKKGLLGDKLQFKNQLKDMWFLLYPRAGRVLGSSGFEHVFVGEMKNNMVIGFHNWISFYLLEKRNKVDYRGWIYKKNIDNAHSILKKQFMWNKVLKPVGSMFIGTSPEYEIAVYTLCFMFRLEKDCNIDVNGKVVTITTHKFVYQGKLRVASAFPN